MLRRGYQAGHAISARLAQQRKQSRCIGAGTRGIRCYDEAIAIDPRAAEAWYSKGNRLFDAAEHTQAVQCYDKALEINPRHAQALHNKGLCLDCLGRRADAIRCFSQSLEIEPRDFAVWAQKARAEDAMGQRDAAIRSWREFLSRVPGEHREQIEYAFRRLELLERATSAPHDSPKNR